MLSVTNFILKRLSKAFQASTLRREPKDREQNFYLSISSVLQKKQAVWLRKFLFKYSTEVKFVLEILGNLKFIASELPKRVLHPLATPRPKEITLKLCGFLLITLVDFTPFLLYPRNYTCYNMHPQLISCLQNQPDLEGCLGIMMRSE